MRSRTKPEIILDYDAAWKWLMETFLEALMRLLYPDVAADIAWERGFQFLDQELNQVSRGIRPRKGAVDKLVRVWLKDGADIVVLIHIEFQAQKDDSFSLRMRLYQARIYDKHRLEVYSFGILGDDDPNWRPTEHGWERWRTGSIVRFRTCKLLDHEPVLREMAAAGDLLATLFCIHLDSFDRNRKAADWLTWKVEITTGLLERGFGQTDIDDLLVFLDWLVVLPEPEAQHYEAEVLKMTKKKFEELYSPWERKVVARRDPELRAALIPKLREELIPVLREELRPKLREELSQEVTQEVTQQVTQEVTQQVTQRVKMQTLIALLRQKFPAAPESLEAQVAALRAPDALDRLLLTVVQAGSVADFERALSGLTS